MLTNKEYEELAEYSVSKQIPLSASVFDTKGLNLLTKFNPPYIKTASCDLNNTRFLCEVAEKGIKMIISTGMSTLSDIEKSIQTLDKIGFKDIVLLHCVSIYPAYLEQTNLSFIDTLKNTFGFPVGFSDHTGNSIAACMALAKGATWFEKHFTEDHKQEGFDHAYAMEEGAMTEYVSDLHKACQALVPKEENITEAERYTRKRARRSLYANRDLQSGEIIKNEDILIVRPESVLDADQIDEVVGKRLKVPLKQYEPFRLENLDE